jgi:hypothetical protein
MGNPGKGDGGILAQMSRCFGKSLERDRLARQDALRLDAPAEIP